MKGIGSTQFWGFSPSFSLISDDTSFENENDEINVLLVGSGDGRHIFSTLSKLRDLRSENFLKKVNIFVYEDKLSLICRISLFLSIFLNKELENREKFLFKLQNNCFFSKPVRDFLMEEGKNLISALIGQKKLPTCSHFQQLSKILDFSKLKYRERDEIEEVFKTWKLGKELDIKTLRDVRLRSYFKDRYDVRQNLFHLDYVLYFKKKAGKLKDSEYNEWRNSGNWVDPMKKADETVKHSNITFASKMIGTFQGRSVEQAGFWCDLVIGPFIGYGIRDLISKDENEDKKEESNGEEEEEDENASSYACCLKNLKWMVSQFDGFEGLEDRFRLSFIRETELDRIFTKSRFRDKFQVVYLDNKHSHFIQNPKINDILKQSEDSTVFVETVKFFFKVSDKIREQYISKVKEFANGVGWTFEQKKFQDSILKFSKKTKN